MTDELNLPCQEAPPASRPMPPQNRRRPPGPRIVACLFALAACCAAGLCPEGGEVLAASWEAVVIDPAMAGDDKALVDIDGDGYPDIVAGGKRTENEPLTWYRYPTWQKYLIALADEEFTTEMASGDMDNDGDPDLVVCDGPSGINCRYYVNPRPQGDPTVQAAWRARNIGSGDTWVHDLRVGDYNNDGRLDLITNRGLFTQNSGGGFARSEPAGGCFGDLDGDGDLDIVAPGTWYENPGWTAHQAPGGGGNEEKVRVADVNGDGRRDIILNSGDGTADLAWYSSPTPKTGPWTKHLIEADVSGGHTLDTGDIDGDGDLDLLSAVMFGEVAVYLNNGGGSFSKESLSFAGAHNAVLGDVDADGDLDVMGCNYTGNPPLMLWRNNRRSVPPPPPPTRVNLSPLYFLLGDPLPAGGHDPSF